MRTDQRLAGERCGSGQAMGNSGELSPLGPLPSAAKQSDADSEVFHRRSKVPKIQGMNFLPLPHVVSRRYL